MNNDPLLGQIILQLVLIALNAVFACAEIAVISMNDAKLEKLAQQGDRRAKRLMRLTSQPAKFLATIQVAITLAGFMGSAFAADNFSEKLVNRLVKLGVPIPEATLDTISVVLITLVLSYFTLVFGELVPKRLAMKKTEEVALGISSLVSIVSKLFAPIVWLLTVSTNGLLRLLGIDPESDDEEVTEEEIRMMLDAGSEKGAIEEEEKELINNVFEFNDTTVDEIATHRTDVVLLWREDSPEVWDETIRSSRYSRYPICGDSIDDVIGILNAKEYFRLSDYKRETVMEHAVYPPYFVPESVRADVLLRNMKSTHNRLAVVLDEYGGMRGIITMNDLLEQLVGDLVDENDPSEKDPDIVKVDENTWDIKGITSLDDISEELGIQFPENEHDTLSGLIFDALGLIPEDGTTLSLETAGMKIDVKEIKDHRVERATVQLLSPSEASTALQES